MSLYPATPFSYVIYAGDGVLQNFSVPFPYLAQADVKVAVNDVETTAFTWLTSSTIRMNAIPALGVILKFSRYTPSATPRVDYADASTLRETDLDSSAKQSLYILQESIDTLNFSRPRTLKVTANTSNPYVGLILKDSSDTVVARTPTGGEIPAATCQIRNVGEQFYVGDRLDPGAFVIGYRIGTAYTSGVAVPLFEVSSGVV